MRRPNDVRAPARALSLALALALALALPLAPAWAARYVQDGIVQDGVPEISAPIRTALERYRGGSEARLLDWLSDGTLLVVERAGGHDQLLRLGGEPLQRQSVGAPGGELRLAETQPFRNDAVAYLGDEAGQGDAALYLRALADGATQRLVSAVARPGSPVWAHDGRRLAFSAMLRDGQISDLYVLDTASPAGPRLVATGGANAWQVLAWTSADRSLLVHHTVSEAGDELLLVDVGSGALRRIDAPGERTPGYGHIGEARLTSDGRGLYFLSDRNSDHAQLRYVDLYAATSKIVATPPAMEVEHFDIGAGDRLLAISWNEYGYSRVALLDRQGAQLFNLASPSAGVVGALRFDRTGARLAIELASSAAPRDVYVYNLAARTSTRWTESKLGEFSAAQLAAPKTLRFQTWDRSAGRARMLSALVYRPHTPGPWPVLVMLGDAGKQARPQLDPFVQYCVSELGLAVVVPGLRAGDAGALDMGALLAWIGAQPDLRRDRVALQGRGSGGTLALTALGLYGNRLRAAVDIDGPATSAQLTPIRAPVLLVRGLANPPLDAGSAEQLLWRLRSAGVESAFIAPRESGDTLAGEASAAAALRVIAQFLQLKLGG